MQNSASPSQIAVGAPAAAAPTTDAVSQAVRFLLHDSVRGASLEAKRSFLTIKGLTEAQIQEALSRIVDLGEMAPKEFFDAALGLFVKLDDRGDDTIAESELVEVFLSLGMTVEFVKRCISSAVAERGEGRVNYVTFISWATGGSRLERAPRKPLRRSESPEFLELQQFADKVAELASKGNGLVCPRGEHGHHILFDESEVSVYFDTIRDNLAKGEAGCVLLEAMQQKIISADSTNKEIWEALVLSLTFSGADFEHVYGILPSSEVVKQTPRMSKGSWEYRFEESIVLGHTLLVVPVMQHYGPLAPKLSLKGPTKMFEQAQPLLAVGMVGDCVKGTFFNEIKEKADKGDEVAIKQRDTLLHPERLQQKMRGLVRAVLDVCRQSADRGLLLDAVLVGSGAFGGSVKVLAQPFADSLNYDMPFDNSKDEVNFFIFPPPKAEEFTLEMMKCKANLNPAKGLGAAVTETSRNAVRVLVAGFDPISIAPHGVINRAFSAEGQLCHSTDILARLTQESGKFVSVHVPDGDAWESPAAFFAKPQELKTKREEGYNTVRFVPEAVLATMGIEEVQGVQLVATEVDPPRVWNGDSFNGWTLSLDGKEEVKCDGWAKIP